MSLAESPASEDNGSVPTPGTPANPSAWAATQLVSRAGHGPAAGHALATGTRMGEFEVQRVLGVGGFGIVYLAQDHMLRRQVAIKEYMPASLAKRLDGLRVTVHDPRQQAVYAAGLEGFINEARLLAQFDHPSLVKVHRFWQANGTAYMVMPYYRGNTLKQVLQARSQPPDEAWLLALLNDLTAALAVVHSEHCWHRDIAPDNVLLLHDTGKPLLLDFGAARQVIGDATQALTAILKPGYAPIEQYAQVASLRQGPWTDVYALCAVVYAAVTGGKPPAAVGRTVNDAYRPLQVVAANRYSVGFLRAIDQGLRLKPDERPASMVALRRALGLDAGPAVAAAAESAPDIDLSPGRLPALQPALSPPPQLSTARAPAPASHSDRLLVPPPAAPPARTPTLQAPHAKAPAVAPARPTLVAGNRPATERPRRSLAIAIAVLAVVLAATALLAWWWPRPSADPPRTAHIAPKTASGVDGDLQHLGTAMLAPGTA